MSGSSLAVERQEILHRDFAVKAGLLHWPTAGKNSQNQGIPCPHLGTGNPNLDPFQIMSS